MTKIDSHQHFWEINDTQYAWINGDKARIRRDYLPPDLLPWLQESGIDGCVAVHARQLVKETPWLLQLADEHNWIRGVVGWAPLLENAGEPYLETFAPHPKLVGVRHVIHDTPETDFIHRDDFNAGIRRLSQYGLVFDVLICGRQLSQTVAFVDRHPDQIFVVDHVARPGIRKHEFDEDWAAGMIELGRRPHVQCKVSGMLTEVHDATWDVELLRPTFETVLEAFGPSRIMFGSDWPVCLLRADYTRWVNAVEELVAPLSVDQRSAFWGENATRVYRLPTYEPRDKEAGIGTLGTAFG